LSQFTHVIFPWLLKKRGVQVTPLNKQEAIENTYIGTEKSLSNFMKRTKLKGEIEPIQSEYSDPLYSELISSARRVF
jgi:hypothetical protein